MIRSCRAAHPDPAKTAAFCLTCRMAVGGQGNGVPPTAAATAGRELPCRFLGKRTEFRAGCGGNLCRHECELGLPAVPGGFCQTCEKYVADA